MYAECGKQKVGSWLEYTFLFGMKQNYAKKKITDTWSLVRPTRKTTASADVSTMQNDLIKESGVV